MIITRNTFQRISIALGTIGLPFAGFRLYDCCASLPEEFSALKYPVLARFHIRRALWTSNPKTVATALNDALQSVLDAGLGAASPQATALVIHLANRYLQSASSLQDLTAVFMALTHKPHVGEGMREEKSRLEAALLVAKRICEIEESNGRHETAENWAKKAIEVIERPPSYFPQPWRAHKLLPEFKQFLE